MKNIALIELVLFVIAILVFDLTLFGALLLWASYYFTKAGVAAVGRLVFGQPPKIAAPLAGN